MAGTSSSSTWACQCPEPTRGSLPDEFLSAIQQGDTPKIESWLANGGDVNAATEGGQTLLSTACVYQNLEVVQKLLQDPKLHLNTRHRLGTLARFTPLCIAAYKGLQEIVSALLGSTGRKCRLDIDATTSKGQSAVMLAAEKNHWEVVEMLCPQVSVPEEDSFTITSLARWAKKSNIVDLMQIQQARRSRLQNQDQSPPSERIYDNNTSPRGIVLILNYKFEDNPEHHRKGSAADGDRLQNVFRAMDYESVEHPDLTFGDTHRVLGEFCRQDRLRDVGCVVVIVLSHGRNRDTFYTADSNTMTMNALRKHFSDEQCPNLKDKAKIFLLQFCRGHDEANQVNKQSYPSSDALRDAFTDMMCLYASQEGFKGFRFEGNSNDPFTGTPFIKAFCHTLESKGHLWLDDLLREFIAEYSNTEYGQPMDCHNLAFRKKFCFNPTNRS